MHAPLDSELPQVDAEFVAAVEEAAGLEPLSRAPVAPPMEFDPPDPGVPGRLAYPDWSPETTRVVSRPKLGWSEREALQSVKKRYGADTIVESCHTARAWAWRVRGEPYKVVR